MKINPSLRFFQFGVSLSFLFALISCQANNLPVVTKPSPSVTVIPSVLPSTLPSSSPTPLPSQNPTTDISESATLNGQVYDHQGQLLSGVKISLEAFDGLQNIQAETTTENGSYVFRNIPVGVRVTVKAEKGGGWTLRQQTVVLKSNIEGRPGLNTLDFGDNLDISDPNKKNNFFLTDSPEVVSVELSPKPPKHYGFSLTLKFSEPVDKKQVEDNLMIRALSNNFGSSVIIGENTDPENLTLSLEKDNGLSFYWDTSSYDKNGQELRCSISDTTAVFTSNKNGLFYGLTLRNGEDVVYLRDAKNTQGLSDGEFYLNGVRRKNFVFSVSADFQEPSLESIKIFERDNHQELRINFSEPMSFVGDTNNEALDLSLYTFFKNDTKLIPGDDTTVQYASSRSVSVKFPLNTFAKGDKVSLEVNPRLRDPAGNFFSRGVLANKTENKAEERFE